MISILEEVNLLPSKHEHCLLTRWRLDTLDIEERWKVEGRLAELRRTEVSQLRRFEFVPLIGLLILEYTRTSYPYLKL
jgi:hypothetical protein